MTRALDGQTLPVYASSHHRREWIHVLDQCRAIEMVIEGGVVGDTYHVGTRVEKSLDEIADLVLGALDQPAGLKTTVPDRPGHDRRYALNSTKLRREIGWRPEIAFEQGLAETVGWYVDHRAWWQPLIDRAPVNEDVAWSR